MRKKLKIMFILIILLTLYIFINAYSYVNAVSTDLSNSVFRLHVIANSDSEDDQNLKYIVRDNLIEYMNSLCENCNSKDDVIETAISHIQDFKEIAENTVNENGFSYPVTVEVGNFEFPTKQYGDISFPAGYYDALRIKIGESNGQNWWCVMFPPLCFINTTTGVVSEESKEQLQDNLEDEGYNVISDTENSGFKIKFKLIEIFEKSGFITAKK